MASQAFWLAPKRPRVRGAGQQEDKAYAVQFLPRNLLITSFPLALATQSERQPGIDDDGPKEGRRGCCFAPWRPMRY